LPPIIGQTISHYRILSKLGEGGMGVVYLAEDTVLGRQVAIKTLTDGGLGRQHFRTRFLREARAVSTLSHPNIATIYDYGETPEGHPFIVMEFVNGASLADLIIDSKLTLERVVEIIIDVARALAEAHRQGIVHRDIKPSNIAINASGQVKVLDFGLAKQLDTDPDDSSGVRLSANTQTREGLVIGTPMYVSPEQAMGVSVDARSDLFSLGSVLYECLTGRPPFSGGSPVEICAKVIRDDPPPPSSFNAHIPKDLEEINFTLLAKKIETRYQTAAELITVLDQALDHLRLQRSSNTVTAKSLAANSRQTNPRETLSDIFKRPRVSIGYVVAFIGLLAVITFAVWRAKQPVSHQPTLEASHLYEKGVAALRAGTSYKASKLLERAVAADGEYLMSHARLAEALTELDYVDRARDALLDANRRIPDRSALGSLELLYFDAVSATVTRDLNAAILAYDEITRLTPNDPSALFDLARAYENNDELDKAISSYQRAAELEKHNPATQLRLAILYGRKQDLAGATAAFDLSERFYKDLQDFEGQSEVAYQRGFLLSRLSKTSEALKEAEKSLEIANVADNKYQQVRAKLLLGSIAYSTGDTAQGQRLVMEALDLARANDMETLTTEGLLDLGYALMIKRSYDVAEGYLKRALDLAQHYKAKRNEARANLLLGTLYIHQEAADKGEPFIEQALTFYKTGGYRREISRCMMMIGRAQLLRSDFDGALKTLNEQLQLAKQVEDPGQLARSQAEVAAVLAKYDFYPQAVIRYAESFQLNKTLNNPLNAAYALLNQGRMLVRLGRYDDAMGAFAELDSYLNALSDDNSYKPLWRAWSHLALGRMYLSQENLPKARVECAEALKVARPDDAETLAEIKATQALIEATLSPKAEARNLGNAAISLLPPGDITEHRGSVNLLVAEARLRYGDAKGALNSSMVALQVFSKLRESELEWRAWLIAAIAHEKLGELKTAKSEMQRSRALLEELRKKWGLDALSSYIARPDVKYWLAAATFSSTAN
jgi:serine/threonine protein kinase